MNDRTKTTLGVVLGLIAWPASGQVVVEGLPLAKRLVTIDHASLSTAAGRRAARRDIHAAAKEVCAEQYPREAIYLYVGACTAGSYGAAIELLDRLGTRQSSSARLSVTVTAR